MTDLRHALAGLLSLLVFALPVAARANGATSALDAESRLLHSLQRTFERAARTGERMVLCPSRDGRECGSSPDWSGGWIAFVDEDGNRERTLFEPLILAEAALPRDVRLRSTLGRTRLVFHRGGSTAANVGFTLCDARGASHARGLILIDGGGLEHGQPAEASVAATCLH